MWFVFGLITLVGSAVYFGLRRWEDAWEGEAGPGGLRYETELDDRSKKLKGLKVAIAAPSAPSFELKDEAWYDRLAKRMGLSVELQVGRDSFDHAVYVVSDDPRVHALLRRDDVLTLQLQALLTAVAEGFEVRSLCCRRGSIRLQLRPVRDDASVDDLLDWAQPRLAALARHLASQPLQDPAVDPLFLRSVLLLATSAALAMTAVIQLARIGILHFPVTVEPSRLWLLAVPVGLSILALLVLVGVALLARSSRAHLVLAELLLVGGLGSLGTAYSELRDLNIDADDSAAQRVQTEVIDRRVSRGRRSTSHYLTLAAGAPGAGPLELRVSHSDYDRWPPGRPVAVLVHPGFLGVTWIEAIQDP